MTLSEDDLIGEALEDVPEREPGSDCNARKSSDGIFEGYCGARAGAGTDHLGEGRCKWHGGNSPRGMDHPNAVHGLRSDYLTDEDQEIYEEVRQHDNADLIQEEIWSIKTKLLRAARAAEGNEGMGMAEDLLEKIEDGQADEDVVAALAKLIKTSEGAVDRAIGRLNDLVKTHHKITEGETLKHEHTGEGGGPVQVEVTNNIVETDGSE